MGRCKIWGQARQEKRRADIQRRFVFCYLFPSQTCRTRELEHVKSKKPCRTRRGNKEISYRVAHLSTHLFVSLVMSAVERYSRTRTALASMSWLGQATSFFIFLFFFLHSILFSCILDLAKRQVFSFSASNFLFRIGIHCCSLGLAKRPSFLHIFWLAFLIPTFQ